MLDIGLTLEDFLCLSTLLRVSGLWLLAICHNFDIHYERVKASVTFNMIEISVIRFLYNFVFHLFAAFFPSLPFSKRIVFCFTDQERDIYNEACQTSLCCSASWGMGVFRFIFHSIRLLRQGIVFLQAGAGCVSSSLMTPNCFVRFLLVARRFI